jgi:hypothetical protein
MFSHESKIIFLEKKLITSIDHLYVYSDMQKLASKIASPNSNEIDKFYVHVH